MDAMCAETQQNGLLDLKRFIDDINTDSITPNANSSYNLGTSSALSSYVYTSSLQAGTIYSVGALTAITVSNRTLHDSVGPNITLNWTNRWLTGGTWYTQDISPGIHNTSALGSTTRLWSNIFTTYVTTTSIRESKWVERSLRVVDLQLRVVPGAVTIPSDDLDYVAHPGHLNLIAAKVEEKLIGNEEVVFDDEEMRQATID